MKRSWQQMFQSIVGRIVPLLAWLFILSVCAPADTLMISQDGIWGTGSNCPPTYCTASGDSWHWSFEIASTPVISTFDLGLDFESAVTNFEFSDNGTVIPALTGSQTEISFFSVAQCGGLATDDQTTIDECADNQLYSGAESAPTFVPGTYSPELIPEVGGCGDILTAICSGVTFGNITVAVVPAQTPEPSSVVTVIVPVLIMAFFARNRRVRVRPDATRSANAPREGHRT